MCLLPIISWNIVWDNNIGGSSPWLYFISLIVPKSTPLIIFHQSHSSQEYPPFIIFHKPPGSQEYPRLSPMLQPGMSWVSNTCVLIMKQLAVLFVWINILLLWIMQLHKYSHCLKSCLREKIEVGKCYVTTNEYLDGFEDCRISQAIALDIALLY